MEKEYATIPFYKHELLMFRQEKKNRRLVLATVALTILLIVSNLVWLIK